MPSAADAAGAAGAAAPPAAAAAGETDEARAERETRVNAFIGKQKRDDDAEYFMCQIVDMTGRDYKVPRWECNGCRKPFSGGKARIRAHNLGLKMGIAARRATADNL